MFAVVTRLLWQGIKGANFFAGLSPFKLSSPHPSIHQHSWNDGGDEMFSLSFLANCVMQKVLAACR